MNELGLTWVIQGNLGADRGTDLKSACQDLNIPHYLIDVIPFDPNPPDINIDGKVIFYGATNFVTTIYRSGKYNPGVFFR